MSSETVAPVLFGGLLLALWLMCVVAGCTYAYYRFKFIALSSNLKDCEHGKKQGQA